MNFKTVLQDFEKLKGVPLCAIARRQTIKIQNINMATERIEVVATDGKVSSRRFDELERVCEALIMRPAVHVEEVLKGGGSRRNQPESMFANLPYIEHLRIDGKKHIAWVRKDSHKIGTLRQMDPVQAETVAGRLRVGAVTNIPPSVLLVVSDIQNGTRVLEQVSGLAPEAIIGVPRAYRLCKNGANVLMVDRSLVGNNIPAGTYAILLGSVEGANPSFIIDGRCYYLRIHDGLTLVTVSP